MAETHQLVSKLAGRIPGYVMLKTKMPCQASAADKVAIRAEQHFAARPDATLSDADALTVDLADGWVSVRGSNAEPVMRIMAEARDAGSARELVDEIRAIANGIIGSS